MEFKDHFIRPSIERSIILMALLAVIESLQVLILVMLIFSFIPIAPSDLVKDLFTMFQNDVRPNRKMFFLHLWVGAGLLIHSVGLYLLKRSLGQAKTDALLMRIIAVDGWWLPLQLFAVFKMIIYPQASWARFLFYIVVGLAVLSRFFWIEINAFLLDAKSILPLWPSQVRLRWGIDLSVVLFLVFSLWIFDLQRLWALIDLAGNRPLAEEGWRSLSPLIKGVDYQSALLWLIALSMIYYGLFYLLLRKLFGSVLLAGCGMLLAVKWQYFHNGITPVIWQFPLKSIVPLLPDVFFWLCLLMHARQQKQWCLALAGVILGFYLAYHFPTGIWLWGGWISYLVLAKIRPAWSFGPLILCGGIWIMALGFQGTGALVHQYYQILAQILQGRGSLPYYDCLRGRNFFAFSMQFIIPLIYFVTIIQPKPKEANSLMVPISIYGLGLFTVHVWQPSLSNYYSVSGPLAIVLCYWASRALVLLPVHRRIIISSLFLMIYAGALLTNNLFGIYPNVWNVSGVNWVRVKAVDQQRMTGKQDQL